MAQTRKRSLKRDLKRSTTRTRSKKGKQIGAGSSLNKGRLTSYTTNFKYRPRQNENNRTVSIREVLKERSSMIRASKRENYTQRMSFQEKMDRLKQSTLSALDEQMERMVTNSGTNLQARAAAVSRHYANGHFKTNAVSIFEREMSSMGYSMGAIPEMKAASEKIAELEKERIQHVKDYVESVSNLVKVIKEENMEETIEMYKGKMDEYVQFLRDKVVEIKRYGEIDEAHLEQRGRETTVLSYNAAQIAPKAVILNGMNTYKDKLERSIHNYRVRISEVDRAQHIEEVLSLVERDFSSLTSA